ncbi:hypothetical protein HNR42_001653 [Deinobacterium chartae]|uniref:Uncharacterized protein n=1 Tax=Deinobacterium chartae TaxID=521158 RepID=A0A841I1P5_9DEIO|nr:hypothetical protein [Deinobacterium chartae]MBB6098228.1 hypothetical protein [Deinobacterium chartae]
MLINGQPVEIKVFSSQEQPDGCAPLTPRELDAIAAIDRRNRRGEGSAYAPIIVLKRVLAFRHGPENEALDATLIYETPQGEIENTVANIHP